MSKKRKHELTFYKKEKKIKPHHFKSLFWIIFSMAAASFIAFVIVIVLGTRTTVIGESMEPTLYNSQNVLINKASYIIFSPKSGDIVAFYPNGNKKTHYYIKRIVAVPGDRVVIKDGHLYINDEIYKDEAKYDYIEDPGLAENEITLQRNEYFIMGDNRNCSEDSRDGNIGPVNKKQIEGKVWFHFKCEDEEMGLN